MHGLTDPPPAQIEALTPESFEAELDALTALLHDCVHAGASVNFVMPFPPAEAEAFWTGKVRPGLRAGKRVVWIARLPEQDGRVVGSVQLNHDTPPNQPHRADVAKLLVHPDARRRGIGRALMVALEEEARRLGRVLLTLDTRSGDAAEPLYLGLGYEIAGRYPGFSRDVFEDRLDATTLMFKRL